jgi:apolipoprotein D and lipocalin family protein
MYFAKSHIRNPVIVLLMLLLTSCMGVPDNVKVVDHVDANQYLGTWYEIARLDHSFERGLVNVSATYSLRDDGGIKVINRGFNPETKKWKEAEGKAYFVDPKNADGSYTGKLKVSFFGPFYGAYNIIELDKPYYNYVMLCGPDKSYFWILSRTPQLPYPIKQHLIAKAKELGFATDKLIYVTQSAEIPDYEAGRHVKH